MEKELLQRFVDWVENERNNISICDRIDYDPYSQTVQIEIEVMGTQFNNRTEFIESVKTGDKLQILRDADNFFDKFTLSVCDMAGNELGTMWMNLADVLSPLLDEGLARITDSYAKQVVPLSQREPDAVKAILQMELSIQLLGDANSFSTYNMSEQVYETKEVPEAVESLYADVTPKEAEEPSVSEEVAATVESLFATKEEQTENISDAAKDNTSVELVIEGKPVSIESLFENDEKPLPAEEPFVIEELTADSVEEEAGTTALWNTPSEEDEKPKFTIPTADLPVKRKMAEKNKKEKKKIGIVPLLIGVAVWAVILGGGAYYVNTVYIPEMHYNKGYELYKEQKYMLAIEELNRAGNYQNAKSLVDECYELMMTE